MREHDRRPPRSPPQTRGRDAIEPLRSACHHRSTPPHAQFEVNDRAHRRRSALPLPRTPLHTTGEVATHRHSMEAALHRSLLQGRATRGYRKHASAPHQYQCSARQVRRWHIRQVRAYAQSIRTAQRGGQRYAAHLVHHAQARRHATRLAHAHSSTRPLRRRMLRDSLDARVRACAHAARQVRAQREAR